MKDELNLVLVTIILPCGLVAMIPGFHPGSPGSIPIIQVEAGPLNTTKSEPFALVHSTSNGSNGL